MTNDFLLKTRIKTKPFLMTENSQKFIHPGYCSEYFLRVQNSLTRRLYIINIFRPGYPP